MTNARGHIVRLRAVAVAAMAFAATAAACTGNIGWQQGGGATVGGTTSSGGSASGSGGAGRSGVGGGGTTTGGPVDIGFATAARLNQTQYNNTIHDLLGTTLTPANAFPVDETVLGFDTISGVLQLHPEHVEQ